MMVLKLLLNIQIISKIFIKTLNNTVSERNGKYLFDDTVADMIDNIKLNQVVTELFIRGRKLNISVDFITQLYLCQKILG